VAQTCSAQTAGRKIHFACSSDVFDLVLDAPADDRKRIDLAADVYQASRSIIRYGSQRGVNFQVAVGLSVLQLDIAAASEYSQHLTGVVPRDQRAGRRTGDLVLRPGHRFLVVQNIPGHNDVSRGGNRQRRSILHSGHALSRSG